MVSVCISGQVISGIVLYKSANTIVVQMVYPESGILMDVSIPGFVSQYNNFDGPYGDDIIYMLLKDAYEIYRDTRDNMSKLKVAYRELVNELAEIDYEHLTLNEFEARRFCKQTLFFYNCYKRYVPRCSWEGILALLGEELNQDLYLEDRADPPGSRVTGTGSAPASGCHVSGNPATSTLYSVPGCLQAGDDPREGTHL